MEQGTVDHVGEYFTVAGAARKLGYDYFQLADFLRRRKDVPRIRLGHRLILVRLADVRMGYMRSAMHMPAETHAD